MAKGNNKPYSTDITNRLLQMRDEVVRDGLAKHRTEFAETIGEHQQNMTKMENGTRRPTLDQIGTACEVYGYSPTWLVLGIGPKKLKPSKEKKIDQRIADLEAEVTKLKRAVKIR
jgi:hypothetical protein